MAKKQRDQPAQLPPSSSSSEGEESSSSSDQEQTSNSSIPHPKKLPIQNKPSESEEESSDDEEDEDEDENPLSVKKPTSNSSVAHSKKREIQNKKSQSEESSDDEDEKPQPAKKPTINSSIPHPKNPPTQHQKFKSEEDSSDEEEDDDGEKPQHVKNSTSSKLKPKSLSTPNKSNGKPPIVRIWSVDDEIMILQAMLEHQSNNECIELNATGIKDLYDSIKKKLSIDVDIAKLVEKIRRIRKKYMGASKKGANLKFPKAHDKTIYDLSDKIWGKKEEEVGFVVNNNSHDATMSEEKSLKREFPFIRDALGGNKLALEMLEKVDVKKAVALEEKFKKLKYAEHNVMREVYNLLR